MEDLFGGVEIVGNSPILSTKGFSSSDEQIDLLGMVVCTFLK
jgi:hypothetical protein